MFAKPLIVFAQLFIVDDCAGDIDDSRSAHDLVNVDTAQRLVVTGVVEVTEVFIQFPEPV